MRIVGGEWGGRRLTAPRGDGTRPTADRVREALFSILGGVEGWRCLDLFAGTGAVGLEALSRGAAHVTFVERHLAALKALTANLAALGVGPDRYRVIRADLRRAAARLEGPYDLVFADPPYDLVHDLTPLMYQVMQHGLSPVGVGVVEHRSRDPAPRPPAALDQHDRRRYGEAALAFHRLAP